MVPEVTGAEPHRPVLIGVSLKMYFDPQATLRWSRSVAAAARAHEALRESRASLVVLPSLPVLHSVVDIFSGTGVQVGAQDLFWEDRGPYTGAVSGADLVQIGCRYVEVGHAEHRQQFGDDDRVVGMKVAAAMRNGLIPILCVGEEHDEGIAAAQAWCIDQLDSALGWIDPAAEAVSLVVAYEPVWAIGRDKSAGADHVVAVTSAITQWLELKPQLAGSPVVYGGSAGPGTFSELGNSVDGLFLGRFAHDPAALISILDEVVAVR